MNNFNLSLTNSKDFSFLQPFINLIQHNIFIDNPGSYIVHYKLEADVLQSDFLVETRRFIYTFGSKNPIDQNTQ